MMIKRIFSRVFLLFMAIFTLYGCNAEDIFKSAKGTVVSVQISPAQITFGSHDVQIAQGNKLALMAIATYEDQSTEDITDQVQWSSKESSVADVELGVIHALSPGDTSVLATFGNIKSNTVEVVITSPELMSIQVTPPVASAPKGMYQQFKALGIYSDGTSVLLNENDKAKWIISDPTVASVSKGKVTALKVGSTEISVEFEGVSSNVAKFSGTDAVIASIRISPNVTELAEGSSQTYLATAVYSDNSSRDVTTDVTWSSANSKVASVEKNKVTANEKGSAVLTASINGVKQAIVITVTDAVLTSIQITPTAFSPPKGGTWEYLAIGFYSDGSNRAITKEVSWNSSDTNVATVVEGKGYALREGNSTITATLDGVSSNEAELTVTSAVVESIQIAPAVNSIAKGSTDKYTAIAHYTDGATIDVSKNVTWISSDTSIATVIGGLATAVNEGKVSIMAQSDGVTSNTAELTVTGAKIASIQITPAIASIAKGFDEEYLAKAIYTDGTAQFITDEALWKSSSTDIATMSGNIATGKKVGETVITASLGGVTSNNGILTVTAKELVSVQVTPVVKSIAKGADQQYVATGRYSDSSTANITELVVWRSSQVNVATIVKGLAAGVAEGETKITASISGLTSNEATLTVTGAELVSIQITPAVKTIPKGEHQEYVATATYTDRTTRNITASVSWMSSDTEIATIVRGLATGVTEGKVFISASQNGVTSNEATLTITGAELISIQVTPAVKSIPKGEDLEYVADGIYSDGTTKNITENVSWVSSDTEVATIVKGLATGVAEGETKITASINGLTSNEATLTVTSAELVSIQVTPAVKSIAKGVTQNYKALGRYSDNTSKDITASVSWVSSDTSIATIVAGTAKGVNEGETKITASQGLVTSNEATLTVTSAELVSIQVTPALKTIAKGQTTPYVASGLYTDDTVENISTDVYWSSTDTSVATVVLQGNSAVANGVSKGKTVITASLDGITSNNAELTVTDATVVSLQITPVKTSSPLGIEVQYEAIATYSDSTTAVVTNQVSWTSSNLNIATISSSGRTSSINKGSINIEATLDSVTSNTAELEFIDAILVSILLAPDSGISAVGDARQYGAIAEYSDGKSRPVSDQVDWFIDDTSVATISDVGLLRAVSPGETKIRVTMGGITSNDSELTVTPAEVRFVEITPVRDSVAKGSTIQYQALARMSTGMVTDATNRVSWKSSDTSIATITAAGIAEGVSEGSVKISATLDGKTSNVADLTVTGAIISSIEITPEEASIVVGHTQQYTATSVYTDGTRVDVTSSASWVSSSVAATISSTGLATGVIQNRVTITAKLDGVTSNKAILNVIRATLASIEVTPETASIPKGTTQQYVATGVYNKGLRVDISDRVTWTRSDGRIASVSLTGLVTGINVGDVKIGAILDGVTSPDADLSVTDAAVSSLRVTPETHSMDKGNKKQYYATGIYTDGSEVDLTKEVDWHVEDTSIASLNITGEATGVDYGSTIVRATKGEERSNNATLTIVDGRQLPIYQHYPWQWFPPQEYEWYVDRLGITPDGAFLENGETGPDGMVVGLFTLTNATAICRAITKPNTDRLFRWKVAPLEASQHLMRFHSNMYKEQDWPVGQYVWSSTGDGGKYMATSFEVQHIGSFDVPTELHYVACVRDYRATGDIFS